MPDEPAYKGKIGRLPVVIRNEVNRRILENESGAKIIAWLHEQPAVLRILDEYFGEEPIKPQNLSEWRKGGYQDWLRKQEEIDQLKEMAEYALKLGVAAGGKIADGSAAIAGGKIMMELETATGQDLASKIKSLTLLRMGDQEDRKRNQEDEKIALKKKVVAQNDQRLELEVKKFNRRTCEMFLKWYDDKRAKDIVESRASNSEKLEKLGQTMFGRDW